MLQVAGLINNIVAFISWDIHCLQMMYSEVAFGNSSSVENNTRSRLPSRLFFRSLWPCLLLTLPDTISKIKISKTCFNEDAQWSV